MSEGVRGCAREFHIVLKGRVCKRVCCHLHQQKAVIVAVAVAVAVIVAVAVPVALTVMVAVALIVAFAVTLGMTVEVQVCVVCHERPPWFPRDERSDGHDLADRTTP